MTHVSLVRRIAARPSIVFEALVTAEGIGSWWGPDDLPVISVAVDGLEHESSGEFLEIDRPTRVVMSWRWTDGGVVEERGRTSRLEISLRGIATGTELTLVHADLNGEPSVRSHAGGWSGALNKLVRRYSASERTNV